MSSQDTIYSLSEKDLDGKDVPMSQYQGKVLMIVNTASKGMGDKKLKDLQKIQDKYVGRPFTILAFPCGQIFYMEKKNNEKIKEKYITKLGLTFPVFSRCDVNGSKANSLYKWLKSSKKGILGKHIEDNFVKFIVESDGKTIHRYSALSSNSKLYSCIDDALKKAEQSPTQVTAEQPMEAEQSHEAEPSKVEAQMDVKPENAAPQATQ